MTEITTEAGGTTMRGTTTRRDVLKKAAVGGAIVWSAPLITSRPAYAQGTLGTDKCRCPNGGNAGGVAEITYEYSPGGCNEPIDSGRCPDPDSGEPGAFGCTGDSSGYTDVLVRSFRQVGAFGDCETTGSEHAVSVNGGTATTGGVPASSGDLVTISGPLNPNSTIVLYDPQTEAEIQRFCYHFSCSQPLCINDEHGPFTVVDYTTNNGCS